MINERKILNSWKEIAGYLGRGVRTIQRYETDYGFPIRRIEGRNRSAVMAFSDEIDEWLLKWHTRLQSEGQALPELPDGNAPAFLHDGSLEGPTHASSVTADSRRFNNAAPTVLIVEDENSAVEQLKSVLSRISTFNFEVYCQPSEAIARLEQAFNGEADMPCLIVLDYELPEATGFSVLTYYRGKPQLRASAPLIVWSVLDSLTSREMSVWMGAKRFISKDVGPTTLFKSLSDVLHQSRIPLPQSQANA